MTHISFQPPEAFITHLTKSGFKRYSPAKSIDDFGIYDLDLTSLKLDVGILVPFVVSKRLSGYESLKSDQLAEVLPDLFDLTRSLQRRVLVLVVGGKLPVLEKQLLEDLELWGVAIIDRPIIESVLGAIDHEERVTALSRALVRYLGRETLSPYVSGRPAVGGRFFGRSSLVQRMVSSQGNFTVIGNRRIGKTSLLKEVQQRLKLQNVLTAEVYGATCTSSEDVVHKLLLSMDRFRQAERLSSNRTLINRLAAYIHGIADTEKRSIAVFIDEVDRILEFDKEQGYGVIHLLREIFEGHQYCRVFLAGFRKVMQLKQSLEFPAFNFTIPIELGLFNRQDSFDMIIKPLERLDIAVSNTDLPEAIYRESGGHPELIQIHCSHVIRYVEEHGKVPRGVDLLIDVLNSAEYKQKVLGTFLANTNAYEELLCYLLFADAEKTGRPNEYEFGAKDVNRVLSTVGIKFSIYDIEGIISNLRVSGIIAPIAGVFQKYQFVAPQLVNYCMGLNLDFVIAESLEVIRNGEQSLSHDPAEADEPSRPRHVPSKSVDSSPRPAKHIYLVGGNVIVAGPEGVSTLRGTVDHLDIEDLNYRCLEMFNQWTDHEAFEKRLKGIGHQLSKVLKIDIPDLSQHLNSQADLPQILITSDTEGLKIPFELLPHENSNLAVTTAVARSLSNYRLPSNVHSRFHQLVTSLASTSKPLRVLLVGSDPQLTVMEAAKELTAVKNHIEAGCRQLAVNVEFEEVAAKDATIANVEKLFIDKRPLHLWHFTGHGRHFSEDPDASGLVLTGDDGQPEVVPCKRLNRWLKGSGLWLAYLSCCNTFASSGSNKGFSQKYVGTMEAVVDAGVPNVVGFRWSVSDQSAFFLADEFYRQVFEVQTEKDLSLAMLEARRAVERRSDFFDAWASSMLITQYSQP